jgi:peptide/nickel transport system substrate-binding protein
MKYLRNNIGYPANKGFVPRGLSKNIHTIGFEYNFEKSKKFLADYQNETGKKIINLELSTDANYIDIVEFLQRELLKIGINIKINIMPPSALRQAKSNGKLQLFRASWIADYPDAENYLSLFYSKNKAPDGPNYTHFENLLFDKKYIESYKEQSTYLRNQIYSELDKMIINEAPIIPLYYDKVMRFSKKNVFGIKSNPINQLNLKRVYKK